MVEILVEDEVVEEFRVVGETMTSLEITFVKTYWHDI